MFSNAFALPFPKFLNANASHLYVKHPSYRYLIAVPLHTRHSSKNTSSIGPMVEIQADLWIVELYGMKTRFNSVESFRVTRRQMPYAFWWYARTKDAKTLTDTSGFGMFPAATVPMKQRRAVVFIRNSCIYSSCYQILISETRGSL